MSTISDIIALRRRRLEQAIKKLQNAKFSTHEELSNRDSVVAENRVQLARVEVAEFPFENGAPICTDCFIVHGHKISCYTTGHGKDDLDVFRCPDCKILIEVSTA